MFDLAAELGQPSPWLMLQQMRPSEFGGWLARAREPYKPPPAKVDPLKRMREWFGHLVKPKGK